MLSCMDCLCGGMLPGRDNQQRENPTHPSAINEMDRPDYDPILTQFLLTRSPGAEWSVVKGGRANVVNTIAMEIEREIWLQKWHAYRHSSTAVQAV